jgi:hypothetical protein
MEAEIERVVANVGLEDSDESSAYIAVVPKVWGTPPGGGGARGAKLFYSQKIN